MVVAYAMLILIIWYMQLCQYIVFGYYTQSQSKLVGSGAVGNAWQGASVAVSGDGMTACIGGPVDNSSIGAVWFYTRGSSSYHTWAQQGAKVVPNDNNRQASFGASCSLNYDGNIAVIGGYNDNSNIGATWIFIRNITNHIWYQLRNKLIGSGYICSTYCVTQGISVAISSTGNVIVTGGHGDNSGEGAAWVFSSSSGATGQWTQLGGKLVGTGGSSYVTQGYAVAINSNATTIAVGGPNDGATFIGSVWIFTLSGGLFIQQGGKLTGSPASEIFGFSVGLSADGSTLVVGAFRDNSNIGAMFVFTRNSGNWLQQGGKYVGSGYVCGTNCVQQGYSVSISANGNVAAIGGIYDNSQIGATWIWTRSNNIWSQYGTKTVAGDYVGANIRQGISLFLSADATVMLIGGFYDNGQVGAAWAFNDPFICSRPTSSSSTIYTSCSSPIPNGTVCTPTCASGYTANASLSMLCNNGNLTIPLGVCNPNCAILFSLPSNAVTGTCTNNFPSGSSCNIGCNPTSYLSSGSFTAVCQTSGVWSAPSAVCTPNPCNRPSDTSSTIYSSSCPSSILSGSSCTPICSNGYSSNAALTITCTAGSFSSPAGTCSPNPCPRPIDTDSTIYSQASCPNPTTSGSTCLPSCASGYTPTGGNQNNLLLTCSLGNFSTPAGTCDPNPCNIPSDTSSTIYSSSCSASTPSGSTCVPICANGYTASGDLTIYCTAGTFSSPIATCNPSPCAPPSPVSPFAVGSCNTMIPSGSSCILGCVGGYLTNGSLSITCSFGNFNNPTGICSFDISQTLCSQPTPPYPKTPGNCPSTANQGFSCELGCANGYTPSSANDFISICSNRTFIYNSTSTAVCLENPCLQSSISLNVGMDYGICGSTTPSNSSCSLTCLSGFTQFGPLSIACTIGIFSSPLGSCQPNPCSQPVISSSATFMTVGDCPAQTSSGSSCNLGCIAGYTPFGILTTTCNLGNFTRDGTGYCVGVSSISTSATSTALNPPLVVSPGTILAASLSSTAPDAVVSSISVIVNGSETALSNNFEMINLGASISNITLPIIVYASITSISVSNMRLSNSYNSLLYLAAPTLANACPDQLRVQVHQSIAIRGSGFFQSDNLKCVLDGVVQSTPPSAVLSDSVTCVLYYPNDTVGAVVMLNVANDGVAPMSNVQAGIPITLIGACQSEKAGSISGANGCECPIGTRDSGSACIPCENGFYQDESAQTLCKSCGNNQDTNLMIGSVSFSACVCSVFYYYDISKKSCVSCISGMKCPGNNVVEIIPGYWRANNITSSVLLCPSKQVACSGSQNQSSSLCNPSYKGPLCTVCEHGYAKLGQTCVICPPSSLNTFALIILVLFAIALAALLIHTSSALSKEEFKSSEEKAEKERMPTLGVIVKVTLNYLQVLYYIGRLSANWSAGSIRFFTVIGQSTLTPNFPTIQCAATWTFYHRLIFIYVSPLIVVAVLVIVYGIMHIVKQKNWKDTRNDCQYAIMLLLYQIHPTIMIEVLSSLPCERVPGSGTSYLKVDMSVDCNGNAYKTYAAISSIYLAVYIFGMIVLVSHRLHYNYINDKLFQSSSSAHYKYAFFFKGFRKHTYYWEAVVMMRKLVIVALSAFASPGLQLVWASVVIVISYSLTLQRQPYSSRFINHLEIASLIALFIAVILGFHFLLTNGNHAWSTVLLIIINGGMAIFLFGCCLSRIQEHLKKLERFLPESWQKDGASNVVMRNKSGKHTTAESVEMSAI